MFRERLARQTGDNRLNYAYISYGTVCLVWGSTYLAIRIGVAGLPPALFAGLRFLAAGFLLFLINRWRGEKTFHDWAAVRTRIVVGILLLFAGNGLVVWAEEWVSSGTAALLVATVPLFMAVMDALTPGGKKKTSLLSWMGLAVGFAGVALLTGQPHAGARDERAVAGLLLASFFWAAGSVYAHRREMTGSILGGAAVEMLAGGAALSLVGLLTGEAPLFHPNPQGWEALAYLVVFGSLLGYTSYAYALQHLPAARVATYAYVNPVVAVILGSLVLHEAFTARVGLAAAVILGGVVMVQGAGWLPVVKQNAWFRRG
ncbi:MAG TPA: EamA family transporter [Spirochaetia bacterium]|nr:EamA family transporter [Spirochaetia bacterium]